MGIFWPLNVYARKPNELHFFLTDMTKLYMLYAKTCFLHFFCRISFLKLCRSLKILMYSEPIYVMIVNKRAVLCTTFLLLLFCISGSNKNVIYCFCIFSASWYYCYLSLFIWEITEILNRFTDLYKLSWDSGKL